MYTSSDWAAAVPLSAIRDTVNRVDATTLLTALGESALDCIVTDPPYGVGTQVSQHNDGGARFEEIAGADWIDETWIAPAYAALKDGGAMYMFAKWRNVAEWEGHIKAAGFTIRNWIVWDKGQHGGGDLVGAYAPQYEMIVFATKGKHILRGDRLPDVIRIPKVHPTRLVHPYEKPIKLLRTLITASTDAGDTVCDPFCGSGTTPYAAKELGRHYIACDVDEQALRLTGLRLTGVSLFHSQTNTTLPLFTAGGG